MSAPDPFREVFAQDTALAILRNALSRDKLASAYLFEGPSGVGKHKAALALARAVVCAGASDPEATARRIANGTHPDVRTFLPREEGDRNIQVETVREQILPFTQFAPFEAKRAFVLLPEADVSFPDNHPEAANALLKTLEEPRAGVHFILLAERPDRLLITIRSRCQKVRFARLPDPALATILAAHETPEATRRAAIALSAGRADRALELTAEGAADALLDLALRIDETIERNIPGEIVDMADRIAKGADLRRVLEALSMYYRDVAVASICDDDERLAFRDQSERLRQRAARVGASRAAYACEHIREIEERIVQNANKEMTLGRLFVDLAKSA